MRRVRQAPHEREWATIDRRTVIRLNRDTLYSFGVLDLDAAPLSVMLPDAGPRSMALEVSRRGPIPQELHP